MTIAEACARLPRQGATLHLFHALIAGGRVVADMRTSPDETMIVHRRDGGARFDRLIPFVSPIGDRR